MANLLETVKAYINKYGKHINDLNGLNLPLDPIGTGDWASSTIDVMTYSDKGLGYLYYHKDTKTWFVKGYAPFDIRLEHAKGLASKFITEEEYQELKYSIL